MLYFKKNLWILFYLIVFIGFLVVSLVSFNLWTQVYDTNKLKQESITKISSSSLHSFFLQYEMILDILLSLFIQSFSNARCVKIINYLFSIARCAKLVNYLFSGGIPDWDQIPSL